MYGSSGRIGPHLAVLPVLLMFGCTPEPGGQDTSTNTEDNVLIASAMAVLPPQGTSPSDLPDPGSDGAQGVAQFCATCHALPSPLTHSATDWPSVMRRMWLRIDYVAESYGVPTPNAALRLTITRYMLDNALRVADTDLPDLRGRDRFLETCTRCHELPDPAQHTNQDWPTVVIRMRLHMVDLLGDSPPQAEIQDIITYLQAVSQ
jgi:hypothetical protein